MKRNQFPWILAGVLLFSWAAWGAAGLVLASLGSAAAYRISLGINPRVRHRGCGGTGKRRGRIFTWTWRNCPRCSHGDLIRWGAGQWGSGPARAERAKARRDQKRARAEHRWR